MSKTMKLGRRGFLGVGAAAAAGVGLGASVRLGAGNSSLGARASVAFSTVDGFPDRPVTLAMTGFDVADGVVAQVRLSIRTPTGIETRDIGDVCFEAGSAALETALSYPFEERIAGSYAYHAEVIIGGQRVATKQPAAYSVRPFVWFS